MLNKTGSSNELLKYIGDVYGKQVKHVEISSDHNNLTTETLDVSGLIMYF